MSRSLVVALLIVVLGCRNGQDPERVGGPCSYIDVPGVAKITSIETAGTGLNNCRNAVEVLFDFVPDDPTAPQRYRVPTWPDAGRHLIVGDGKNPSLEWVTAREISVGKEYPCLRQEITSGTCTPVVFDVVGIDFTAWADYCF